MSRDEWSHFPTIEKIDTQDVTFKISLPESTELMYGNLWWSHFFSLLVIYSGIDGF